MNLDDFFQAAFQGDIKRIRQGIASGIDVNTVANNGMSLLMISIRHHDNLPMVQFLLDKGADLHYRQPSTGWNAVTYAALHDYPKILTCLFEKGALMGVNNADRHALMYAVKYEHLECVRVLLQNGANINVRDSKGQTALIRATRQAHTPLLTLLLNHSPNLDDRDRRGMTALMYAMSQGSVDIAARLYEAGADDTLRNAEGRTAGEIAEANGYPALVELLSRDR